MLLFDKIIAARGLENETRAAFLSPDYLSLYDPFLLPDMEEAVVRIISAKEKQEKITIYGDYDIDGITSTTLLLDALKSFGFCNVEAFMPNRFTEGYGMTVDAIEQIAKGGTKLVITVDCGSMSHDAITRSNCLGVDVIVTDHHSVAETQPPAIAVINPKRLDNKYPFIDLAGVGVAFKLVQALQTKLDGLPFGQEKWLLDLVALGTVCDIALLKDENRVMVYWGLKVLSKARRPWLRALMLVAGVDSSKINTRSLGFGLGPRMNAAGRLETAQHALELLTCEDPVLALEKAQYLDELNKIRQSDQSKIIKSAIIQAEKYNNDSVLVLSSPDWSHGIVGIVASKLLEIYHKPVFVIQELGDESKGSARSFGDFAIVDSVNYAKDIITSGGGHKLAAGVKLPTKNIGKFREAVNEFYKKQNFTNQHLLLLPSPDAIAEFAEINEELVELIHQLEPFGHGNPQPILRSDNLIVVDIKRMGSDGQHLKVELKNPKGDKMKFISFGAPKEYFVKIGSEVSVMYHVDINEWQGERTVEGSLVHLIAKE